jgi:hypothetical protein
MRAVTEINLAGNDVGDAGALLIGEALAHGCKVRTLVLDGSEIGDPGASAIAHALQRTHTLSTLRLKSNHIGDAGAAAFAETLRHNTALTGIDLCGNPIGDGGAAALEGALLVNTGLVDCTLRTLTTDPPNLLARRPLRANARFFSSTGPSSDGGVNAATPCASLHAARAGSHRQPVRSPRS